MKNTTFLCLLGWIILLARTSAVAFVLSLISAGIGWCWLTLKPVQSASAQSFWDCTWAGGVFILALLLFCVFTALVLGMLYQLGKLFGVEDMGRQFVEKIKNKS